MSLRNLLAAGAGPDDPTDASNIAYELTSAGVRREYGVDLPPEAEPYRVQAREFLATYLATPQPQRRKLLADTPAIDAAPGATSARGR